MFRQPAILWILVLLAAGGAAAAADAAAETPDPAKREAEALHRQDLQKHRDNADMLVLPGLVADRKAHRVTLYVKTTGLGRGATVEFFLVGENSGHDYESLALSFAKPSDIHKALLFLGMQPGRPVDPRNLRFWPKGERVIMTFAPLKAGDGPAVRAERLVWDKRTDKPLPDTGLVFTGSYLADPPDGPGAKVYAADALGPNAVATTYNEPNSVFDVPRIASQSDVYADQLVNLAHILPTGGLARVILEPEYKDGKKRVTDLVLDVRPLGEEPARPEALRVLNPEVAPAVPGQAVAAFAQELAPLRTNEIGSLQYVLTSADGVALTERTDLSAVMRRFASLSENGHDVFVSLRFAGALPLRVIRQLAFLFSTLDTESGIRIEPPAEGQLYYKAFTPNPRFRERAARVEQPWELRLTPGPSGLTGTVYQIRENWKDGQDRPDLDVTPYEVTGPDALRKVLDQHGPGLRVILVFAPSALRYGALMKFLQPALRTHGTVHVFLEEGSAATTL